MTQRDQDPITYRFQGGAPRTLLNATRGGRILRPPLGVSGQF